MKRILLGVLILFLLFVSCATQKNNIIELRNNGSVEKIELLFRENNEIIIKNINEEYWETIITIIAEAEYDIRQYNEIKNPSGYMLKIIEQDYILKIFHSNNGLDEILIWNDSDRIKTNGKWYIIKNGKVELFKIIDYSKL